MPRNDNVVLVATIEKQSDIARYADEWAAFVADQENADREREMRKLGFGQRQSHCG